LIIGEDIPLSNKAIEEWKTGLLKGKQVVCLDRRQESPSGDRSHSQPTADNRPYSVHQDIAIRYSGFQRYLNQGKSQYPNINAIPPKGHWGASEFETEEMDNHIKIGKSILDQYARYAEIEVIDDRAEYFPTVKVIIKGIVESLESRKEKETIQSTLIDYVKEKYVSLWLKHAAEDEEDPDIDHEKESAAEEFDRFYFYR
jgi:hypothetical protein